MFSFQQQSTKLDILPSLNSLTRLEIRGRNFERQWLEIANLKELVLNGKYSFISPIDDTSAVPITKLTYKASKSVFVEDDTKRQILAFTDFLALCHQLTNLSIKIQPHRAPGGREHGKFSNLVSRLQPLVPNLERLEVSFDTSEWGQQEWLYNGTTIPMMCSIANFICLKEINMPQEAFVNNRPGRARIQSLQGILPQSLEKLIVDFATIDFLPLLQDLCSQQHSLPNLAEVTLRIREDWNEVTSGVNHSNVSAMGVSKQRVGLSDLQPWFTLKIIDMREESGMLSGLSLRTLVRRYCTID
jgi:hypothetical protein